LKFYEEDSGKKPLPDRKALTRGIFCRPILKWTGSWKTDEKAKKVLGK